MTQTFEGAQPKVVKGKQKFRKTDPYGMDEGEDDEERNEDRRMFAQLERVSDVHPVHSLRNRSNKKLWVYPKVSLASRSRPWTSKKRHPGRGPAKSENPTRNSRTS